MKRVRVTKEFPGVKVGEVLKIDNKGGLGYYYGINSLCFCTSQVELMIKDGYLEPVKDIDNDTIDEVLRVFDTVLKEESSSFEIGSLECLRQVIENLKQD